MLSTAELLDLAKERQGGVTDYRIAKLLGISTQNMSNYRCARSTPSNPVAMRLGELAGVDPAEAVAFVNIERAKSPDERAVWEFMLTKLHGPSEGHRAA